MPATEQKWEESDSAIYIDYGPFMVPDREYLFSLFQRLIPNRDAPYSILEIGCGGGDLAKAICDTHPNSRYLGLDGSEEMRAAATQKLSKHQNRFSTGHFDLFESDWRKADQAHQAIVSSFVIHHLDGEQKAELFKDLYQMLAPGGQLLIADIVAPQGANALRALADDWDEAVRDRSERLGNSLDPYNFFIQEEWNIFNFPDPMDRPSSLIDQLSWLASAGFTAVDAYWSKAGHALFGGIKPIK